MLLNEYAGNVQNIARFRPKIIHRDFHEDRALMRNEHQPTPLEPKAIVKMSSAREQDILWQLKSEISKPQTYCGSIIPMSTASGKTTEKCCPPFTIRWENQNGRNAKITLPHPFFGNKREKYELAQLEKEAKEAVCGEDYHLVAPDELQKKVGRLEESNFSTSFNPYEFGIVDVIKSALLPRALERMGIENLKIEGNPHLGGCGKVEPFGSKQLFVNTDEKLMTNSFIHPNRKSLGMRTYKE